MLVHSVFFWLKTDLSADLRKDFEHWLNVLTKLESVDHGYVGVPSSTNRPVIDRSYSFALTVIFKGIKEHDLYQVDPDHLKFVDEHKGRWSKIVIYDAE